jgi:outer membrane protein assembly factor BamB
MQQHYQMMVNTFRLFSILLLSLSISACGTVSGWFEEDVYEAPPTELVEFAHEFEPTVVWSKDTGGTEDDYSDLSVWIQNERVYSVDAEGEVQSYDIKSGKKLWTTELDTVVMTGVGGGQNLILIGTKEGGVIALDEVSGKELWQQSLTSEVLAPPKSAQGVVVARTADGRMNGLSATDGTILWNYQRAVPLLSLRGASAPIIADDKVLGGYANGKLIALALSDGAVVWEKSVAVPRGRTELDRIVDIDADPVVYGDVVYAVAFQGRVAALSLDSGRMFWSREASSRSGLDAVSGDAVYLSDNEDNIWSFQDGSGDALWRQTRLLRRKVTAPAVAGDNLIIGDFEGYVHFISRHDGHFVSRIKVSDSAIRSKPIVKDGLIFINASDGELTVLRVQ